MKSLIVKMSGLLAALALVITAANVNVACMYLVHQPKLPSGAEKFRKF